MPDMPTEPRLPLCTIEDGVLDLNRVGAIKIVQRDGLTIWYRVVAYFTEGGSVECWEFDDRNEAVEHLTELVAALGRFRKGPETGTETTPTKTT